MVENYGKCNLAKFVIIDIAQVLLTMLTYSKKLVKVFRKAGTLLTSSNV